ncbi:MAG: hypothetical protein FWC23_00275 [Chitinispirillia bacterium]|nr:hypothetical protein [Chitinispirillia bacterium]MCL2267611.1 hypothetical protein [Chitinispirillia bacterium]
MMTASRCGRFACVAALFAVVFAASAYSQVAGAIQISTFDDLLKIGVDGEFPLDGSYELTGPIDASPSRDLNEGLGFAPIGRRVVLYSDGTGADAEVLDSTKAFSGRFDGKGFAISGLYINRNIASEVEGANIGLFGFARGAEIRNLYVHAESVAGHRYVGALVGRMVRTRVDGCYTSGRVVGVVDVGGLVGGLDFALAPGTVVVSSYSSADVSGGTSVGGLVGSSDRGSIIGCYTTGTVTGSVQRAGGLLGRNTDMGAVWRSYSFADVAGETAVGGLVGENSASTVALSYFAGTVTGSSAVGGLAGVNSDLGTVSNSFWDTERSGQAASAGGGTGKTTVEMLNDATYSWLFATDTIWGWANNYPYIKRGIPTYTMTFKAGLGGQLSGSSAQAPAIHRQTVNPGIGGAGVTAGLTDIGESFAGWYLGDEKLAAGQYDGFKVAGISNGGLTVALSELSGDVEIEARFVLRKYEIAYTARANGRVIVGTGTDTVGFGVSDTSRNMVEYGSTGPRVEAVPAAGFKFVRWDDEPRGTAGTAVRAADTAWQDTVFTAIFVSDTATLTYNVEGNGILRIDNSGAAATLPAAYKRAIGGTGPTVRAMVHPTTVGWRFAKWSDGVTDSVRVDANVQEDIDVVAIFELIPFSVMYVGGAGGKVVTGEWIPPPPPDVDDSGDDTGDGGDDVVDGGDDVVDGDGGTIEIEPFANVPGDDDSDVVAEAPVDTLVHIVRYDLSGPLVTAVPDNGYQFVKWSDGVMTAARTDLLVRRDTMYVAIFEEMPIAVKSGDRIIPDNVNDDVALVPPVVITASVVTAGPNPVSRRLGNVNIFRQGRAVRDGKLSVYNAFGTLVKTIGITDKSAGTGKRRIGSWDLTDRKGAAVAEGTYLVKGTLMGIDGAKERVSLIVGVR